MSVLNLNLPQGILRGSLGIIHPFWPAHPHGVELCWAISTEVIWKKDDSMFGTKFSLMVTQERLLFSIRSYDLEVAQSNYTRRDATALGVVRTPSRIDRFFDQFIFRRYVISTARLRLLRTLGRTFPSPIWFFLQQLHDEHRFMWPILCTGWIFQVLLHKAMEITTLSYRSKQPCIGAKLLITLYVLVEIYILGHSCDVVKLGNLLKIVLIYFGVLISIDIATFLLALVGKTFRHVKLRSPPSLGRKQKTVLCLDVEMANVSGATGNLCWL